MYSMSSQLPAPLEDPRLGPAMRALPNERWRAFVEYLLATGTSSWTEAARAAGFKDGPGLPVTAHRMVNDERVQAALAEHGQRYVGGLLPIALRALKEMIEDPDHRQRFQAVDRVMGQAGLHSKTEVRHTHEQSPEEMISRIRQLADFLGVAPDQLLGGAGPLVDVTPETPVAE